MSNKIIPGILEKDWTEIERKIEITRSFFPRSGIPPRGTKEIHIDFVDGKFANNLTLLDPSSFSKYTNELYFEAHLMVEEPLSYLKPLATAGFKRFLGHVEKMSDQEEFVAQGEILGEVGLALDLDTPIDGIKVPFEDLDCILLMSIHAGFSGQDFEQSSLEKIKTLRSLQQVQGKQLPIEVDGGVSDQNIIDIKNAGANRFVATHFLFNSNNPAEQLSKLTGLVS